MDELREAAEAVQEMGYDWSILAENLRVLVPNSSGRFIAAATPELILTLLDKIDEADLEGPS